jgi:hypothetical protein
MPISRDLLEAALVGYQSEITRIQGAMAAIRSELKGAPAVTALATPGKKRSRFSAATRKKMAAAQKARWAAIRAEKSDKA